MCQQPSGGYVTAMTGIIIHCISAGFDVKKDTLHAQSEKYLCWQ